MQNDILFNLATDHHTAFGIQRIPVVGIISWKNHLSKVDQLYGIIQRRGRGKLMLWHSLGATRVSSKCDCCLWMRLPALDFQWQCPDAITWNLIRKYLWTHIRYHISIFYEHWMSLMFCIKMRQEPSKMGLQIFDHLKSQPPVMYLLMFTIIYNYYVIIL